MDIHGSVKRKREERSESSTSTSTFSTNTIPKKVHSFTGPHFYKIIVAPSTQNYTLRIPEQYVKKYYEDQLAKDCVKLKVADGRFWKIELLKDESGRVWLNKGWEKVVDCYSLKLGDFLLFKYDEDDSHFHVWIFDTTGCEVEYHKDFLNSLDKSREIIDISSEDEGINSGNGDDDERGNIAEPGEGSVGVDEKAGMIRKLEAFENQKPYFKVCMQPLNLFTSRNQCPRLSIPMYYARKHIKNERKQELILKGPNKKKSYNTTLYVRLKNSTASIYGNGWRNFTVENELKKGDECVFEMINPPRSNAYKVTIFRLPR